METFSGTYRGKKVLVTGHTGFKGAWLCEWLLKLGAQVSGLSLNLVSSPSLFQVNNLEKRMRHFEADVRDLAKVESILHEVQPEIIFHLAAQSLVRKSYDEPVTTFETNVMGTVNILEATRRCPSVEAVVIVTTDKCYLNSGSEFGFRETDPLGGKDPYSASKAAAEIVTQCYLQSFSSQVRAASVRAGNVVGGGDWADDRIIPDCMRSWEKNEPAKIRNPESIRPWQHVLEPLSGYLWLGARLLAKDPKAVGEAFNFGPEKEQCKTVKEVVLEMNRHFKKEMPFETYLAEPEKQEAQLLMLNCDKAYRRLQWKPALGFAETFSMTAEWYLAYFTGHSESIPVTQMQISEYEAIAKEQNILWAN